jgi:TonB family protein
MRDLAFGEPSPTFLPRHRRSTLAIAAVLHMALFTVLTLVKTPAVRISPLESSYARIAAYVAPARRSRSKAAAPKETAPATPAATETAAERPTVTEAPTATATEVPADDRADAASADGPTGATMGQSSGPVRLGNGGTLTLLKKVPPIYPSGMQSARVSGVVVLDAVIHSNGTIGDITVLRSTNALFAQAAIEAVKKWRYTPLPYEGIVTVTVNFTLT